MKMHRSPDAVRAGILLLILAALAIGLALYLHISGMQSEVNRDFSKVDQGAYMHFAIRAYESNFSYTGDRNRMPLFPWIQALFYSPDMSDEEFFEQGKQLNVLISITCLTVLGTAFFLKFSKSYAFYAVSVIAFLCFAIKAPWFQAEILFYVLFAFAFMLSIESIRCPKWYKSVGLGLLFALAHFTKASALPGLAIYACSFAVPLICEFRSRSRSLQRIFEIALCAFAPLFVFMVALFPYFNESKERYGHYLYNVNSTFYIWYDSWGEAKFGTKAAGDREGWPDMPDEEIPSLTKYLNEHSASDITRRFTRGMEKIHENACSGADSPSQFGLCFHAGIGVLVLFCCLFAQLSSGRGWLTKKDIQTGLFAGFLLAGYFILYIWYAAIASGPRFILALLIPLFWTAGLALRTAPSINVPGTTISIYSAVIAVALVILFSQTYEIAAGRAYLLFGGF